ncbi:hypothetical protein D3C73_1236940 [compost metagenome]
MNDDKSSAEFTVIQSLGMLAQIHKADMNAQSLAQLERIVCFVSFYELTDQFIHSLHLQHDIVYE